MLQRGSRPAQTTAEGQEQGTARVCTQDWDPGRALGSASSGVTAVQLRFLRQEVIADPLANESRYQ